MRKINRDQVIYIDSGYMQIMVNKADGYVNLDLLSEQINMFVFRELRHPDFMELAEHIRNLTEQKELYHAESTWSNLKGWYIHPMIALELVAIKKNEDSDYTDYYNFIKESIFKFLVDTSQLKERYFFMEEFHG